MEYVLLGWAPDGPRLRLDHRQFAYAGKFARPDTGTAVVREDPAPTGGAGPPDPGEPSANQVDPESVLGALSFSPSREDASLLWFRYLDVRADRRGEQLGPRLCRFVLERAYDRGIDEARIAVNNPFAYHALHRAGFGWTGETAGMAELVLSTGASRDRERYQAGLDEFRERDTPAVVASFLAANRDEDPPSPVTSPDGVDRSDTGER